MCGLGAGGSIGSHKALIDQLFIVPMGTATMTSESSSVDVTAGRAVALDAAEDHESLRQAVKRLAADDVEQVLVTCADDNAASAATIEPRGGALKNVVDHEDDPRRRYWIGPRKCSIAHWQREEIRFPTEPGAPQGRRRRRLRQRDRRRCPQRLHPVARGPPRPPGH